MFQQMRRKCNRYAPDSYFMRAMMSRPTFTCLILMAMVVTYVQSHWSMMEGMWRAQIDLLPVFAAFAALHGGLSPIIGLALIAGSWLDVLSANPLGTSLVSLFLTALVLHRLHEVLLKSQLAAQFFVCLAAGALGPITSCLFLWVMSMQPLAGWGTLWQIVVNAMICGLAGPFIFLILNQMDRLVSYEPVAQPWNRSVVEVKRSKRY